MAEMLVSCLAWSALQLTSSLVSKGFQKLIGAEEETAMVEWSGDVVFKAREKSQQQRALVSSRRSQDMAPMSRALEAQRHEMRSGLANLGNDLRAGLGAVGAAAAAELAGVRSEVHGVKHDLASVRTIMEECRAENTEFFESFTASLEATQQGINVMRSAPLQEAEMFLKNFEASNGNVRFLEIAHNKAMTALVQGHSLDVKLSAALIAVSSGYVHMSKVDSPSEAKNFTVNGTLSNIVKHFAPLWAAPSATATADGRKVLSFLLNVVACVCVLPSESIPVLPKLDKRLLPAFGALCAAEPELRGTYPVVAGVAVRAMLEAKNMKGLFQLAEEVGVDVDNCTSKGEVVQALLASNRSLVPRPAMRGSALAGSRALPAPAQDATTDRATLVVLFNATGGPFWKNSAGWGTSAPLGEWHGVTVDGGGRVLKLELGENNLIGQIPPALGNLTALIRLYLFKNQLTGPIPREFGSLTALQKLSLSENELSGPIPAALGGLESLTHLLLFKNKLTGPIPRELGRLAALQELSLRDNDLSGPIPAALGGLESLARRMLFNNKLTGPIPRELGSLTALQQLVLHENQLSALGGLESLTHLVLYKNKLTGPIPRELGRLTALQQLGLSGNQLSGPIPAALGGLESLTLLQLFNNKLTGPIPRELGRLTALQQLGLSKNQLSGPIPAALGGLESLTVLQLYENKLTGPIPRELGSLTALEQLDLSENQLSGPIPAALGGLESLTWLLLYKNKLTGPIPAALGGLESLTFLQLYMNKLTGPIPRELGRLTALQQLSLRDNDLSGPIPAALGGLESLTDLMLYKNKLTGSIPAELGRLTVLQFLELNDNQLSGPIPTALGGLTALKSLWLQGNNLRGRKADVRRMLPNCSTLNF